MYKKIREFNDLLIRKALELSEQLQVNME
jgi:hypothetical protein